eukprot:370462_1
MLKQKKTDLAYKHSNKYAHIPINQHISIKYAHRKRFILIVLLTIITMIYLLLENQAISPSFVSQNQFPVASTSTSNRIYLTFYLRMYHGTYHFYSNYWFPSLKLFWPFKLWEQWLIKNNYYHKISILIVLDNESSKDHEAGNQIISLMNTSKSLSKYFDLTIIYENKPTHFGLDTMVGHDRQQWSMFYIDKFVTNCKFVAIMDTDSMFQTIILPQYLFINEKPIIIGYPQLKPVKNYDNTFLAFWKRVPRNTIKWLNIEKEPLKCMSYFPVTIKTKHFKTMRDKISQIHNQSFDQVFIKLYHEEGRSVWAQFNIFCAYLWYYHQDEYYWYINRERQISNSSYYFIERTHPAYAAMSFEELYTEYNKEKYVNYISFEPGIHVMTHVKYMMNDWHIQYKNAILFGYCYSVQFMGCNKTEIINILMNELPHEDMSNILISQFKHDKLL